MFDEMTTAVKLAIGGVILGIILVVVGIIVYQHHEVGTLQQGAGAASAVIADQSSANSEAQVSIAGQTQTAQNTDQTTQDIQQSQQANTVTQTGVEKNTQAQMDAANQQYQQTQTTQPKPVVATAADQKKADVAAQAAQDQHSTQLASIQIDSLWDTYANTCDKTDPQCVAAQPAPTAQ